MHARKHDNIRDACIFHPAPFLPPSVPLDYHRPGTSKDATRRGVDKRPFPDVIQDEVRGVFSRTEGTHRYGGNGHSVYVRTASKHGCAAGTMKEHGRVRSRDRDSDHLDHRERSPDAEWRDASRKGKPWFTRHTRDNALALTERHRGRSMDSKLEPQYRRRRPELRQEPSCADVKRGQKSHFPNCRFVQRKQNHLGRCFSILCIAQVLQQADGWIALSDKGYMVKHSLVAQAGVKVQGEVGVNGFIISKPVAQLQCNPSRRGAIRWNDAKFEGCNGETDWQPLSFCSRSCNINTKTVPCGLTIRNRCDKSCNQYGTGLNMRQCILNVATTPCQHPVRYSFLPVRVAQSLSLPGLLTWCNTPGTFAEMRVGLKVKCIANRCIRMWEKWFLKPWYLAKQRCQILLPKAHSSWEFAI